MQRTLRNGKTYIAKDPPSKKDKQADKSQGPEAPDAVMSGSPPLSPTEIGAVNAVDPTTLSVNAAPGEADINLELQSAAKSRSEEGLRQNQ